MIPLFEKYPLLEEKLPFCSLGEYPTPILNAAKLDTDHQCAGFTIKHDGLSGRLYGGNKVRKLEFLLADALAKGKTDVHTFGGAGSNHALATAIYAQKLGLTTHSMLIKQPNSHAVRNNLLRSLQTNAELQHFESITGLVMGTISKATRQLFTGQGLPYFIPPGGTSPVGLLGYVNAAFELHAQLEKGELAPPDVIYVACGTMGTCVGLALGLRILGLKTKICAVAVTDNRFSSTAKAKKLFDATNTLLCEADNSIPRVPFEDCDLELRHDYFGEEYGLYTEAGKAAIHQVKEAVGLEIEGCYTGKCVAALVNDLQSGRLDGQQVLFWNTYNGQEIPPALKDLNYLHLPEKFHRYFEVDVQILDQD